jgi:hypothetical protein
MLSQGSGQVSLAIPRRQFLPALNAVGLIVGIGEINNLKRRGEEQF